ncbi:MAG: hypothetical protein ACRDNS_26860, partial [Trebonia sp.]
LQRGMPGRERNTSTTAIALPRTSRRCCRPPVRGRDRSADGSAYSHAGQDGKVICRCQPGAGTGTSTGHNPPAEAAVSVLVALACWDARVDVAVPFVPGELEVDDSADVPPGGGITGAAARTVPYACSTHVVACSTNSW